MLRSGIVQEIFRSDAAGMQTLDSLMLTLRMLQLDFCKIERVSRLVDTNLIMNLASPKKWIVGFDPIANFDEDFLDDAVDPRAYLRGLVRGDGAGAEYRGDERLLEDGQATDADRLGLR
jgi:hypothetical protein